MSAALGLFKLGRRFGGDAIKFGKRVGQGTYKAAGGAIKAPPTLKRSGRILGLGAAGGGAIALGGLGAGYGIEKALGGITGGIGQGFEDVGSGAGAGLTSFFGGGEEGGTGLLIPALLIGGGYLVYKKSQERD